MQILMGLAFGGLMALFFTSFGMSIQKKIDGKDDNDDT